MADIDPVARVGALFDSLAETYDDVGVDFFQPIAAGLLAAMPPVAGERWLDIGCGRGAVTLPAAAGVGPSGSVVGIDVSRTMLDIARAQADALELHNVVLDVGNAMSPALPAESFDAITSSLVLFFLPDPAQALRAWRGLLVPGGRLGVTTFGEIDARWEALDELFLPYLPPALLDARTSGTEGAFASDAAMEALVREAGFTDVRTVNQSLAVRFEDAQTWRRFTWSTGQRQFWLAIPEDVRDDVLAQAYERLAVHADDDGSITFMQGVRHTLAVRPVA